MHLCAVAAAGGNGKGRRQGGGVFGLSLRPPHRPWPSHPGDRRGTATSIAAEATAAPSKSPPSRVPPFPRPPRPPPERLRRLPKTHNSSVWKCKVIAATPPVTPPPCRTTPRRCRRVVFPKRKGIWKGDRKIVYCMEFFFLNLPTLPVKYTNKNRRW